MTKGITLLLITVLGWGVMYPASKIVVDSGIDGFYVTAIRYGLGSLFVSFLLLLSEGFGAFNFEGKLKNLWFIGTMGFAGLNFFTFVGITFSSAEHATVILAMMPMMAIFLSWFLDSKRPSSHTLVCAAFAFLGIFITITKLDMDILANDSLVGDILLLAGTASWVLYTYFIRQFSDWSPLRVTALSSIPGTVSILAITAILTALGIATAPSLTLVNSNTVEIFILVVTTAVIVTWNGGIKILGVVNGMLFVNLVPVVTFTIGYLKGNDISQIEVIGATVTIVALIANNLLSR